MDRLPRRINVTCTKYIPSVVCGVILLFSSLAFAQSTIQGVVKDNVGNGMEQVSVKVTNSAASRTAKTDSEGRYTIADLPPGVYTVSFEADKYVPVNRQVTVPANGKVLVDAAMKPEETVGVLQVESRSATKLQQSIDFVQGLSYGTVTPRFTRSPSLSRQGRVNY
jgi:hypothetical protein